MRVAVTGGGTGGHVFPALEIALAGREAGWDLRYYGSIRGQEGAECGKQGLWFQGYASEPVIKVASLAGVKSLIRLFRAAGDAKKDLREFQPDVLFSTGGYSSAPVVRAAQALGIPTVIHEQNSVPGRTNTLMAKKAFAVCSVFKATETKFPGTRVIRTGMPLRRSLREAAQGVLSFDQDADDKRAVVLVMGGSQGAVRLNDVSLETAVRMAQQSVRWIHLTGVKHFEAAMSARSKLPISGDYDIRAFLDADGMRWAFQQATLAVCRSGAGSLSELAAFRRPSILVPFPTSFANHQLHNAQEFEAMGAAMILPQSDLEPSAIEGRVLSWLYDEGKIIAAQRALAEWDIVDAVPRILDVLIQAREGRK
jgi:UDP-N-acetylglucosamine--N-acetylmuramyl-(pentapeptide) pyrophosphoryl-undecaprenol N-acetylglucosamine transferase